MSKDLATDRQTATNKSKKPRSTSPIPRQIVNKICTTCNGTGNIPSDAHVGGSMECASCLGRGWNYRYKAAAYMAAIASGSTELSPIWRNHE